MSTATAAAETRRGVFDARRERLRERLDEPLLVTSRVNVFYLTGFDSSNAALVVAPDETRLFADFRYAQAAARVPGVEFVETGRALLGDLARRLEGRIGFEADALTYAGWETLRSSVTELVPRRGAVEQLRVVKDEGERATIREAAAMTTRAFSRFADDRFTGRSERDLAWRIEQLLREEGADRVAFPVIVAAGPTGATPHAKTSGREVGRGETVVVDAAASLNGYQSDCTRTFATGPLPERLAEAYEVCRDAQAEAVRAARPGVGGRELDAVARSRIDATSFAGTFGHGLGHGLGLELQEAPVARPESTDVLAAGNVLTIEPGIYLPGEGGVRIEDLVIVTDDGVDVLTAGFTKELVTVA